MSIYVSFIHIFRYFNRTLNEDPTYVIIPYISKILYTNCLEVCIRVEYQIVLLLIIVGGALLIIYTGDVALILDIAILILMFLIFNTLKKVLNIRKEIMKSQTKIFDLINKSKNEE